MNSKNYESCVDILSKMKNGTITYDIIEQDVISRYKKKVDKSDIVVICGTLPFIVNIAKRIKKEGKQVVFLDRITEEGLFYGFPIISLDDIEYHYGNKKIIFVIASRAEVSYYKKILGAVYPQFDIISFESMLMIYKEDADNSKREFYCYQGIRKSIVDIISSADKYLNLLKILEDEESRDILCRIILFRTSFEVSLNDNCKSVYLDYMDRTIYRFIDDEAIADIGGYNGDNIYDFLQGLRKDSVKNFSYYFFEPVSNNLDEAKKLFGDDKRFVFERLAVSDTKRSGYIKSGELQSTVEKITNDKHGTDEISITTIDDYFYNKNLTLIKMDIEGEELSALRGGEKVIKRLKPRCVICLYHKYNDILDIFDYFTELNLDYKYYLRCHRNSIITEFVLYAV